ncbi:coumaroyl-CoA:anthocyanidin 3-O-glucoside-6''-O-coumaroyltransferase 1-like [Humulus lupulus]|uniref:coumaroyl-CoA:anthocyanidin 3-O-glucoside-6''-O-coumaroyltransferase 1-like n=1 Tax=Humulus lupulus TaxID=3486 RepID=UPI002B411C70|nr:coumaroyl-CoA:anthocyanidin 3-O-glucoside-6''-O-coumaroyltransferase 1-like [Humulus lupulus]
MAAPLHTLKIVEQSQVSPPPGSVPTTSLPLTFFDLLWYVCCPMQRLYFYQSPHPTQFIYQTLLPNLKNSLSLTLKHFFPYAGNLICSPSPARPHILYTEGDSVPFTIAESDAEFDRLVADYPRDVQEHHPFVTNLPPTRTEGDARVVPLMALQVTVFPNSGISIGVTFCHMVADGRAFHHFMKSWASVCKSNGDLRFIEKSMPFHGRVSIKIPCGVECDVLKSFWDWASVEKEDLGPMYLIKLAGKVRATFNLGQAQIERLKHWVKNQFTEEELETLHISTFVVTCALSWVCLIKSSQSMELTKFSKEDEPYFFAFVGDCRNRLESPIPNTYFGNCLAFCFLSVNRNELLGEKGIVAAAKGIGKRVKQLECNGALEGAENWMQEWKEIVDKYKFFTVAGSPKLGIYDTDFGLGRPKKTELLHTDVSGAISLSDSRENEFGVEVSLAISKAQMDCFSSIMEDNLQLVMI